MPIFRCRLILTFTDEHAVTVEIEADTAAEAMQTLRETQIAEMQQQPDYHSADETVAHFRQCTIDGKPVGDWFRANVED